MENVSSVKGVAVGERTNSILYPTMLIAAIAVIIFSVVGIAAMTGLIPSAMSKGEAQPAAAGAGKAPARAEAPQGARSRVAVSSPAAGMCVDCGVVSSIRAVQADSAPTGIGAVAGGVVGGILGNQVGRGSGRTAMTVVGAGAGAYAGHEIEKRMDKGVSYEVRVRMDDGSYRVFYQQAQPALAVGQKVRVTDKGVVAG